MPLPLLHDVSLAGHTTLRLGGPARDFVTVDSVEMLQDAVRFGEARGPVLLLGGGSNLVVSDAGFDGLVVQLALRGIEEPEPGRLVVSAGEPWEAVVEHAVERGWAGIECLSGIPGSAGATPIQNVGAYGQDVGQVISAVEAVDLERGRAVTLGPEACGFAYRDSRFKRERGRWVVTAVHFQLRPGGDATVAYGELKRALEGRQLGIAQVRDAVVGLRRRKSMVLDPQDPESRSVGSFFTNPIVGDAEADRLRAHAVSAGMVAETSDVPSYPSGPGRVKFPAAWLIERAGIRKGLEHGGVAVSSKHTLALVHRSGGTTQQLLELARLIRGRVFEEFGVRLEAEPTLVGVTL